MHACRHANHHASHHHCCLLYRSLSQPVSPSYPIPRSSFPKVGIIALNLIGEYLPPVPAHPGYLDTAQPRSHDIPYYNNAAIDAADLNLDMQVGCAPWRCRVVIHWLCVS